LGTLVNPARLLGAVVLIAAVWVCAIPRSAAATESLTARGQIDAAVLTTGFTQAGLGNLRPSTNTITLTFPREGGAVSGDFVFEIENFPLGEFLASFAQGLAEGLGGAIGGGIAGAAQAGAALGGLVPGAGGAASGADPVCPPMIGRSPLSTIAGGAVQELPGGLSRISCHWATGQEASISVSWYRANPPSQFECRLPEVVSTPVSRPLGQPTQDVRRYSQTKAAKIEVFGNPGIMDQLLQAGAVMLSAAEALAAPCPRAAAPAPTAAPAPSPTAATAGRIPTTTTGVNPNPPTEEGEVGADELYTGPGKVPGGGVASEVLKPGSDLPTKGEAAAAAGAAVVFTTALATMQAIRAGRGGPRPAPAGTAPVGSGPAPTLESPPPAQPAPQPTEGSPTGGPTRDRGGGGGGLLPNPREILKDRYRQERNRVIVEALARKGVTPPILAAFGGVDRVANLGTQFIKNPPRAIGNLLKDTWRNITHPKELGRHILNGVRRVVENSPVGAAVNLFRSIFGRRRGPRAQRLEPGYDPSKVVIQRGELSSTRPEAPRMEDYYPEPKPEDKPGE